MDDNSFKTFEDLKCWQACREVRIFIYGVVKNYPKEEKYSLADNMKRAARSTTENIAEGFGRFHYKENAQFCRIGRGSLFELLDDLITSVDEKYINQEDFQKGGNLIAKAHKLLNGYINYLSRQSEVLPITNNK